MPRRRRLESPGAVRRSRVCARARRSPRRRIARSPSHMFRRLLRPAAAAVAAGAAGAAALCEPPKIPPAVHAELERLRPGEPSMRRKWEEDEDHWHKLPPRAGRRASQSQTSCRAPARRRRLRRRVRMRKCALRPRDLPRLLPSRPGEGGGATTARWRRRATPIRWWRLGSYCSRASGTTTIRRTSPRATAGSRRRRPSTRTRRRGTSWVACTTSAAIRRWRRTRRRRSRSSRRRRPTPTPAPNS